MAGSPVPFRPVAVMGGPSRTGARGPVGGPPDHGRGVLATVAGVLVAAVGLGIFLAVLAVVALVFVVALAAALCVVAVRGVVHALSPHAGGRPAEPARFGPASVIDSTATVIRRASPKSRV